MPVFDAQEGVEADSAEMIAKRQVGRFRQVKSKTDACLLEWWRDKGSVARDRAGGVVWGWLSKLARRALAMPATSAAAERLFSQASSVLKANRKRIKVMNSLLMLSFTRYRRSRTLVEYAQPHTARAPKHIHTIYTHRLSLLYGNGKQMPWSRP